MPGKSTLSDLYLGSEPIQVAVQGERLVITLANEQEISIPLQLVGALSQHEQLTPDAQLLILRRPPQIDHVHVTDNTLTVYLKDGRVLLCPLAWFPRLLHAAPNERNDCEILGNDDVIHWPTLDEDIELSRLIEGGKSLESESSVRKWLQSRQVLHRLAAD